MKLIRFFFAFGLLFLAWSCKKQYVEKPTELPTIKQAKLVNLQATDDPIPVYASGVITALESMRLSFKTGGYVNKIVVDEGQYVKKGQTLATLNTSEIDAQVNRAQLNVDKVARDLARLKRLYADSAATLQSIQDTQTALEVAKSDLIIAKFNQTNSTILAPVAGRVQMKLAEENELVTPGQPILTISSKNKGMSLNAGLSDRDVVKLKLGDTAKVKFDAYPDLQGRAIVTEIGAEANPLTGTFQVELTIQGYPKELKSGFFAKASIFPSNQPAYFKIPMHAMVSGNDREVVVFVPEGNKAKSKTIRPQFIGNEYFTVLASTSKALTVLTDGAAYLREGEAFQSITE